jgi:hypothetical protein
MSEMLSATRQVRAPLPSAISPTSGARCSPRSPAQIIESEACYRSQLIVRNNPKLWKLLFTMQEDRRPWGQIFEALMAAAVR